MAGGLAEIYARVLPFARAMPLVAAIPFAAELAQHIAEIRIGMYEAGGVVTGDEQKLRLAFGAVKVLAIFLTLLFALRFWAYRGDAGRAARPTAAMLKGLGLVLLVQAGGELLIIALGAGLARIAGAGPGVTAALTVAPLLLWLLLLTYLLPWFVALLTEDRDMTLRRSIDGTEGRLWANFGLLIGSFLPALVLHYALGYAAMGRAEPVVWAIMLVDSALVAALAILLASAYFTLYRRAAERVRA
jgi:hypothetical protein